MGSRQYEGWAAVSKLEVQDCCWCSSSLKAGGLKTQRELIFQFESEGRKRLTSQLKGSQAEGVPSISAFFFYLGLLLMGWGPPTSRRTICFPQPTDSNVISSGNTLTDTHRIMFDEISGHPVAQSSSHVESTIFPVSAQLVLPANLWGRSLGLKARYTLPQSLLALRFCHVPKLGLPFGEEATHGGLLSHPAKAIQDKPAPSPAISWPWTHWCA